MAYKPNCLQKWQRAENYAGEDYSDYYVVLGTHRDATLMDESNWDGIQRDFGDKEGVETLRFNHWAVGWVEQMMVRKDAPDEVLEELDEVMCELKNNYPLYDEQDYCNKEYDNSIENIGSIGRIDEDEAKLVYSWLARNNDRALEGSEGAYPPEEDIQTAMFELMKDSTIVGEAFEPIKKRFGEKAVEHMKEKLTKEEWKKIKEEIDDYPEEVVLGIYNKNKDRFRLTQFVKGQRRL